MRLVDSSAWVEWLSGGAVADRLEDLLPAKADCLVPTIVQLELAKWLTREKGEAEADRFIAYTQTCRVVALDTPVALLAAELCRIHKLATADAVIYASALYHGADVLTLDKHFHKLEGVIYIDKRET